MLVYVFNNLSSRELSRKFLVSSVNFNKWDCLFICIVFIKNIRINFLYSAGEQNMRVSLGDTFWISVQALILFLVLYQRIIFYNIFSSIPPCKRPKVHKWTKLKRVFWSWVQSVRFQMVSFIFYLILYDCWSHSW